MGCVAARVINPAMSSGSVETQGFDARKLIMELAPVAVAELHPGTELVADLGFDSLGLVELVVAIEDALDLPPVDVESLGGIERVEDVEELIAAALADDGDSGGGE